MEHIFSKINRLSLQLVLKVAARTHAAPKQFAVRIDLTCQMNLNKLVLIIVFCY